jgi:hypothetical protein
VGEAIDAESGDHVGECIEADELRHPRPGQREGQRGTPQSAQSPVGKGVKDARLQGDQGEGGEDEDEKALPYAFQVGEGDHEVGADDQAGGEEERSLVGDARQADSLRSSLALAHRRPKHRQQQGGRHITAKARGEPDRLGPEGLQLGTKRVQQTPPDLSAERQIEAERENREQQGERMKAPVDFRKLAERGNDRQADAERDDDPDPRVQAAPQVGIGRPQRCASSGEIPARSSRVGGRASFTDPPYSGRG